jgi:hypothetical protein
MTKESGFLVVEVFECRGLFDKTDYIIYILIMQNFCYIMSRRSGNDIQEEQTQKRGDFG